MATCDYLLPRRELGIVQYDEDLPECLLKKDHKGEHLVKTSNGYFVWLPQETYCEDCDCTDEGGYIECFIFGEISEEDAVTMLKEK